MKIAFFVIFDPTLASILAQKRPKYGILKQNFTFQSLRKTEAILLPNMWIKDWLTKVKTSKIVIFVILDPEWAKVLS